MSLLSGKKILLLGFIIVLLIAIPLTVYLVQQQQKTKTAAVPATIISFSPDTQTTTVDSSIDFDINVDPGTNQVSFVKLLITYDATKLSTAGAGLVPNTVAFPSVLQGPTYAPGSVSLTVSVGGSPQSVIQTKTKLGKITFQAIAPTEGVATNITFGNQTQVLSIGATDQFNENVLSKTNPASVIINAGEEVTPTITITPTPILTPTATPTPTPTTTTANQGPACSALELDRSSTGTAPYSLVFTARGTDADSTISKVTFSFGDGTTQDVTQTGGLGTNNVAVQTSHTYNNAGTYNASAILTDNLGAVNTQACTQLITINAAGGGTSTVTVTTAVTAYPTITPTPAIAATGPRDSILLIGAFGAVLSVLGAIILLAL